jgi:hypothetical protein
MALQFVPVRATVKPVPVVFTDLDSNDQQFYTDAGIPVAADKWTRIGFCDFRLYKQHGCLRLWKQSYAPWLYGGSQIHNVVADSRLAREWVEAEQSRTA